MSKIKIVVICSPTATGKTELGVRLADRFAGEIINADSMQVYRYMDIGTAKPTPAQRERVSHHLIDMVNPDEDYNAAIYAEQARETIQNLACRGKRILVVGGTGLYIRALLQGIIATPPVDEAIRNHYKEIRDRFGREHLYRLLCERDPRAAARINPRDAVRVIRALEVLEQSGQSIIALQQEHSFADRPYDSCTIGLLASRDELKKRIADRTRQMMEQGLIDEVRDLLARGYSAKLKSMQSLGYKQVIEFILGRSARDRVTESIIRDTWQYAKRQMTWFSADKSINWFEPAAFETICNHVALFWEEKSL